MADLDPAPAASAPDKRHGDPLLNAAQGSGDVHGTRHGLAPDAAAQDEPADAAAAPDRAPRDGSPEAPGVGGDAGLHDLGGNIGPTSPSSRGGGGLGPTEVREADERAARDRAAE